MLHFFCVVGLRQAANITDQLRMRGKVKMSVDTSIPIRLHAGTIAEDFNPVVADDD